MTTTANLGLTLLEVGQAQKEATLNTNFNLIDAGVSGGTSFPGTPPTGKRFFRSDRGTEYYYDGTRWLSTQLFAEELPRGDSGPLPYTVTSNGAERLAVPSAGVTDLWLVEFQLVFFVVGGTALGASHKWVSVLSKLVAAGTPTTVATVNIDSGASSSWRVSLVTIGALLGTTFFTLDLSHTKTGTPGNLFSLPRLIYRRVG